MLEAQRIAAEQWVRLWGVRLRALAVFLVLVAIGFVFRSDSPEVALALVACLAWAAWQGIKAKRLSGSLLVVILCAIFLVGSMLADLVSPPSARCADGTYSYAANSQGGCSHHGGVYRWNPGPWWLP